MLKGIVNYINVIQYDFKKSEQFVKFYLIVYLVCFIKGV